MVNLRVYVGTYKKYNEGSLFGEWIDFKNYSNLEEFYREIRELHKDEVDPEFMFQDYECSDIISSLGLISESYISKDIFKILEIINESDYNEDIIASYLTCTGEDCTQIENVISKISEVYSGEYNNDIDFTQTLLEDTGSIPSNLPSYLHIDWKRTSRDIMFDYSSSNNHYFRNY